MQEDLTGATTTEPRLATYAVSWRMMTDLCESTRERCRRSGEGWVIDPRRPPTLISIAYLCEEHARAFIASQQRLAVKARFVRGQTNERGRWLTVEWRVGEDN